MSKSNKTYTATKQNGVKAVYEPAKSIVNWLWVQMREQGAETLAKKKEVCADCLNEAIENRYIQAHIGNYMRDKINKMRSHNNLQKYLINSKNFFEKNFVKEI